jgi:hypothetical protein
MARWALGVLAATLVCAGAASAGEADKVLVFEDSDVVAIFADEAPMSRMTAIAAAAADEPFMPMCSATTTCPVDGQVLYCEGTSSCVAKCGLINCDGDKTKCAYPCCFATTTCEDGTVLYCETRQNFNCSKIEGVRVTCNGETFTCPFDPPDCDPPFPCL